MIPRDQDARDRIRTDIRTNLLVEAGAGSGKTTSLVERMLEHVRSGTPVEKLAAVTFTKKAANELRERFQMKLEDAAARTEAPRERDRFNQALRELDSSFIGTIHAFCGRLLREHPLEVGLDPNFRELEEDEMGMLRQSFWRHWGEEQTLIGDSDLAALQSLGVRLEALQEGFRVVVQYPDVDFPTGDTAMPDIGPCRTALEKLLARGSELMPAREPSAGWDDLMSTIQRLEYQRQVGGFATVPSFCEVVARLSRDSCKATQNRWTLDGSRSLAAKELSEEFGHFYETVVVDLVRRWREHRYPPVMRALQRAAAAFSARRQASGTLGFEDLLLLAARLLRENPDIRDELGARYAHLLVDEFQDTDPVQAEVCFLLASDSNEGTDWRTVVPRPGSLFVVGDPKQSIYRFRRADIEIYDFVKRRMDTFGSVLSLTANFRSVSAIRDLVNEHFSETFPADATREQAPFSPMETVRETVADEGVSSYAVSWSGKGKSVPLPDDAALLASWIARLVAEQPPGGSTHSAPYVPGDFLVLTERTKSVQFYATALAERNIPVSTAGADLPQEYELRELRIVLSALSDPANPVMVAAALEGLFFGLTPGDLWDGSRLGVRISIVSEVPALDHPLADALVRLREWWTLSQQQPADIVVERILNDTGLLIHAAGQAMGDSRAGTLLHLVESLRAAGSEGSMGMAEAMTTLEAVLAADNPDCSLRPGRTDAVRIMNLHKAKGLEARVVILAAPANHKAFAPLAHIVRGEAGHPTGGLCISEKGEFHSRPIAHPPGWGDMQAAEERFAAAERVRLLYVAATRARSRLVISRAEQQLTKSMKPDNSIWRPLVDRLALDKVSFEIIRTDPTPRPTVERSAESLNSATSEAKERVATAAKPSFTAVTITDAVKREISDGEESVPFGMPRGSGAAAPAAASGYKVSADEGRKWGRAVHKCIEALGRGRSGDRLQRFIRAVAREQELTAEQESQLALGISRIAESESWRALSGEGGGLPLVELTIMHCDQQDGYTTIREGVLDAASHGESGWQIVDWKTDRATGANWELRREQYERQVAGYAELLTALTSERASGTVERVTI